MSSAPLRRWLCLLSSSRIGSLKADLAARLNGALTRELCGIPVETAAEVGDPATAIAAFAHDHSVDFIMMPTHGYGPFRRLLLGSVTAKILHDVHCPVWTGAHAPDTPGPDRIACRTVLCAIARKPSTPALVRWAVDFARRAGTGLRLVHVIHGDESWPESPEHARFEEWLREKTRADRESMLAVEGIFAPVSIATGSVAEAVREEAQRHAADLVMIGRGAIQDGHGRLHAHAYGIVRGAPCPVISI